MRSTLIQGLVAHLAVDDMRPVAGIMVNAENGLVVSDYFQKLTRRLTLILKLHEI